MKAALAQLTPTADPQEGCARAIETITGHPDAELVVFPELFVGGYASTGLADRSIAADDPAIAGIAERCREVKAAAVVGFAEKLGGGRFANSAICIDRDGKRVGVYRKTHLFGPGEKEGFEPGGEMLLTRLGGRATGPQICFDVEFPEPSRMLAVAGADLLITVAANMKPYAADHRLAARARALDNRLPHLYVNRTGSEAGLEFVGESCLISAGGDVIAELGPEEAVLEVEVPAAETHPDRSTDYLGQIRPDLEVITIDPTNGEEL